MSWLVPIGALDIEVALCNCVNQPLLECSPMQIIAPAPPHYKPHYSPHFPKGRYHRKKHVFFRALPEKGGGGLPMPEFFGPFFTK